DRRHDEQGAFHALQLASESRHRSRPTRLESRRRPDSSRPHIGDMHIRNVPTNIRSWDGGTEDDANSIFIFETAGLCIAHLGHLHHPLTPEHLKQVGHVDVLLVPVDGSYTLDTPGMMEVIDAIRAPLILPMHYFDQTTLNRFLDVARPKYEIEFSPGSTIEVSRQNLPSHPKMLILPERHY
ncbi:MAG TPA: MBL fold metallo-hydrolase, partial [Beijerinckiaceae bacterium]|nr:MBL fold metallo-hydrolase [Beijerinckiaceae bacterium]